MTSAAVAPPRHLPAMIFGAAGLCLLGAFALTLAARALPEDVDRAVAVTVTASACSPSALTVPAGVARFAIRNASDRPLEWEILDGVMVVAERENIAPGFSATLSERLAPGTYAITCGLLSNPRGTLTVTETAASSAARVAPPAAAFIGPLGEARVQALTGAAAFEAAATALRADIVAGDRAAATATLVAARTAWARLGMVAPADLSARIAPEAAMLAGGVQDPAFSGLHRIEASLRSGAPLTDVVQVADALVIDAGALTEALRARRLQPADLAAGAARLSRRLSDGFAAATEDRPGTSAALQAIGRTGATLAPLLSGADSGAAARLAQAQAAAEAALVRLDGGAPARASAAAALGELAEAWAAVNPALGLAP